MASTRFDPSVRWGDARRALIARVRPPARGAGERLRGAVRRAAVPAGGAARRPACAATGVPGELMRWTRDGVEFLHARADGLTPAGTLAVGTTNRCPAVAGHAGGAAVRGRGRQRTGIRVVVRDPGGAWGAPVTLAATDSYSPEAAINARGDAVVLWAEILPNYSSLRLRGARRPAGGSFGPIETFATGDTVSGLEGAVTGAGETFVLVNDEEDVRLTSAPSRSAVPAGPPARAQLLRRVRDRGHDRRARAGRRRDRRGPERVRARAGWGLRAPPLDPRLGLRLGRCRVARRRRRGRQLGLQHLGGGDGAVRPGGLRASGRVRRGATEAARPGQEPSAWG